MTTTASPSTPVARTRRAQQLVKLINKSLLNAERALTQLIAMHGWIDLGYATFADCWAVELSGNTKLSTTRMKASIVFQLIDEGLDEDAIIILTGIMDHAVHQIVTQKATGVVDPTGVTLTPYSVALKNNHGSIYPAPHSQNPPGPITKLPLSFGKDELAWMKKVAKHHDIDIKQLGQNLLRAEIRRLNKTAQIQP